MQLQTKMSPTTFQESLSRSKTDISLEVTAILICLASVLGNLLVVYVINKYSEMKTITNIFIHNLSLSDVFMATLNMPFWITSLLTGKWNLSHEWCEVSASVSQTLGLASMLNVSLNSLNRYIKFVKQGFYLKYFLVEELLGSTVVSSG